MHFLFPPMGEVRFPGRQSSTKAADYRIRMEGPSNPGEVRRGAPSSAIDPYLGYKLAGVVWQMDVKLNFPFRHNQQASVAKLLSYCPKYRVAPRFDATTVDLYLFRHNLEAPPSYFGDVAEDLELNNLQLALIRNSGLLQPPYRTWS